jgi:hypothetical protein
MVIHSLVKLTPKNKLGFNTTKSLADGISGLGLVFSGISLQLFQLLAVDAGVLDIHYSD